MYLFLLSFNVSIYTKERDIAIFVPLMKQRWQKHRHGIDVVPLVEYQATHGSLYLQYPKLIRVSFSFIILSVFPVFFLFLVHTHTHTHTKKKTINKKKVLPAFFAARNNTTSMRCWAGSPSGNEAMKDSTWATASSLVKYW